MIDYKALAKEAALDFIHNNTPLNCSITKIAEQNNLNPQQIQRVSELSNKAVHHYCLLKEADKNFSFELADGQKILSSINNNNDVGLTSGFEPEKPKAASFEKLNALFGNPESIDLNTQLKRHHREDLLVKLSAAIDEIDSRITATFIKAAEDVQDLKGQIAQLKMYGIQPEDIRQLLVSSDPRQADEINKIMKTVAPEVTSGSEAKPPEQAEVQINPTHPVVIKVHSIFAHNNTLHTLENSKKYLALCKDKLEEAKV